MIQQRTSLPPYGGRSPQWDYERGNKSLCGTEESTERSPQTGHIRMRISSSDVAPQEDRKHWSQCGPRRLENNHIEVSVGIQCFRDTPKLVLVLSWDDLGTSQNQPIFLIWKTESWLSKMNILNSFISCKHQR